MYIVYRVLESHITKFVCVVQVHDFRIADIRENAYVFTELRYQRSLYISILENQHAYKNVRTRSRYSMSKKWAYDMYDKPHSHVYARAEESFIFSFSFFVVVIITESEETERKIQSISIWMRLLNILFQSVIFLFRLRDDLQVDWRYISMMIHRLINTFHLYNTLSILCMYMYNVYILYVCVYYRYRWLLMYVFFFRTSRLQWATLQHHCLTGTSTFKCRTKGGSRFTETDNFDTILSTQIHWRLKLLQFFHTYIHSIDESTGIINRERMR